MDYISTNRALWDSRVEPHFNSDFYDVPGFLNGANMLTEIELPLLGNVSGKSIIHLQCHFGMDTLSLARMGASVTGIDLSGEAISKAQALAAQTDLPAHFIQCDVYDAPKHITEKADMVFTSYGTIGWLPDMDRWAKVIAACLKPGGTFVFAEFHPAVWMFDNDFKAVSYSYFKSEPIIEQEEGTYADRNAPVSLQSVSWNHSIGEVYTALRNAGFQISYLQEYDFSPYPCFSNIVQVADKRWHIRGMESKLPMVYALKAVLS